MEYARRFEAIVVEWDGSVAAGPDEDLAEIRGQVEAACAAGLHLAVVGGTDVGVLDSELGARPGGPGRLLLAPAGPAGTPGRDEVVYEVGPDGPQPVPRSTGRDGDDAVASWLGALGVPPGQVLVVDGAVDHPRLGDLLADQVERRRRGELPDVDVTPGWTLTVDTIDPEHERARAALLTIADGSIGSTGCPTFRHPSSAPRVMTANVYDESGPATHLLHAPVWYLVDGDPTAGHGLRRVLDLRTGLLHETTAPGGYRSVRFSSLHRPGTVALRAVHPGTAHPSARLFEMPDDREAAEETVEPGEHAVCLTASEGGGLAAAALERVGGAAPGLRERVAVYLTDAGSLPDLASARAAAREVAGLGFERLLGEHRQAWAARWDDADVVIDGDDEMQLAVRAALYHLFGACADHGEAAVGARGLSGPAYAGHVFWDSDVFVLPAMTATHPESARAMLEYRVRRLAAARAAAQEEGRRGARFPWESATTGRDVTPTFARDLTGHIIPIRTGQLEVHIVACVAWAASHYVEWTGDLEFAAGPGRTLLVETARYWASRIRSDARSGHIYGVIGPDEYHEPVDDSAFTNVMARWNLRRAAQVVREHPDGDPVDEREIERWLALADRMYDGYDPATGIYEEFAGYHSLEPLLATRVLPRRPMPADLVLGAERLHRSQIVKQADVLMLHHLVPSEVEPGSLVPNLDFYEPRTSHGSSLSPAIHAVLMARVGRPDEALETLRMAADIDLRDTTSTTAGGLHVATLGGIWQAVVLGFCGVRPRGEALHVDPCLPRDWNALDVRVRFRGARIGVRVDARTVTVTADRPLQVFVGQTGARVGTQSVTFDREDR
ncbi:MAG TPA: glycosyl hydrolase family 65 protein [Acidimicrobiia bacterium]|nr:glycosyl hydrolase family 65 protein [Acidimicrobiia bacterium]